MTEYVAGRAADLPEGGSVTVRAGRRHVTVFHVDGRYYALPDKCPHKGASLAQGTVRRRGGSAFVRCPWHSWEWCLETGRLRAYPGKHTSPVEVRVVDGEIRLRLP